MTTGRAWAESVASEIMANSYLNMSVTYSKGSEYGSSEDILKPFPSVFEPSASIPDMRPSMAWRLARSLETLRNQVNAQWPNRDKRNDGTIGDANHQQTTSDHNPNSAGVVTAMDITHDPASGMDADLLAEALRHSEDDRIKYVIRNGRIFSRTVSPWIWRERNKGPGDHTEHVHISVEGDYDNTRVWAIKTGSTTVAAPAQVLGLESGKGSWYSQYSGKYQWVDTGDAPGSAALGCPDDAQGVSFYDRSTLGKWFEVHAPNGKVSIEQQTDIGPHPNTGRLIDIAAAAAERFGYSPKNFPTDSIFSWRPAPVPIAVVGLSPVQQATRYRDLRTETPMAEPQIFPPGQPLPVDWEATIRSAVQAAVQAAIPVIVSAVQQRLTQPLQLPPPQPEPPPVATPATQKPSVQLSVAGLFGSLLAMASGQLGTPFGIGPDPTTTGTLATLIPIATGALGLTGTWGAVANVGLNLLGSLLKNRLPK